MTHPVRRRTLLAAAGTAAAGALARPAPPSSATPGSVSGPGATGFATFRWLGVAGWQIRTPRSHLLVDPYLTRFDTGLAKGRFSPTTGLTVDPVAVDDALGRSDESGRVTATLVTHTHWDHFGDVPHIATTRGGTVFTTLTGYHLARSLGVDDTQVAVLKGGEEIVVGDLVVRAVRSLHSRARNGGVLFPGVRHEVPRRPATIADLPEGDTLAFLLRAPTGRSVLLLGASDFDDTSLRGLRPDVVTMPVPANDVTNDYVERLLDVLDSPRVVVPVHWDHFETPPTTPPTVQDDATAEQLRSMVATVHRVAPHARVVMPDYRRTLTLL
ncbi:MBL fold metallo-hydrolase [Krasilnikoviella flava]|uniref:L-ascorbate metabolism protein UlaG, beta-lactamase superfamily n=1 Tax=Krasilnikoviella flava TaxID=526729 RepID=A0A1T5LKE8_9MICO|nr:MBL fold metallo-hydrolase [Krasilnikoviella flava]SKC76245.1 L-ascorbate metabolism protein UlaG, beta-lactamase superfamily [Krasilnikoviella flava]